MAGTAVLEQQLKPLEKYLKWPGAMEIAIQEEGGVYILPVQNHEQGWIFKKDPNITFHGLKRLAEQLAVASGQKFHNKECPVLSTAIPGYGYRVQILGGGAVGCGFALSIRIAKARRFPLDSYFNEEDEKYVRDAIAKGTLILVVGGTGSGKTTLMNSLLTAFPDDHRLITIEDAKELSPTQRNVVDMLVSKTSTSASQFSYNQAIDVAVRMKPNAILLGEITIENALPFLKLSNTGHGSSLATLHADEVSVEDAYNGIALNIILSGVKGATFEQMYKLAERSIGLVITIQQDPVTGKFVPKLHKKGDK